MNPELPAVVALLDELEDSGDVRCHRRAKLSVQVGDVDYTFALDEAEKLLQSPDSVKRFYEALGSPDSEDARLTVSDIDVPTDVTDLLEELFNVEAS